MDTQRILVTGASAQSDIGLAICQYLAEQGYQLILCARTEADLVTTQQIIKGDNHIVAPFDLAQTEHIANWVTSLVTAHGPLSGIVHSASYQGYTPLKSVTATQINTYMQVNFAAAVMLCGVASKKNVMTNPSGIVMLGSVAGERGVKARTLYAASKAALHSLTQSAAVELASKGVRVNCVAPGVVSGKKAEQQFAMLNDAESQKLQQAHPLGLAQPEDVAAMVGYLLGQQSQAVTGTIIPVDGGYLAQ
jgi:NAD(P)-dependent dehydrogenase (short-subunit alcohol dehydrogenase family)